MAVNSSVILWMHIGPLQGIVPFLASLVRRRFYGEAYTDVPSQNMGERSSTHCLVLWLIVQITIPGYAAVLLRVPVLDAVSRKSNGPPLSAQAASIMRK